MEPIRYFRNELAIWKFVPGERPQLRSPVSANWAHSMFATLDTFLRNPLGVTEIPAEEGEQASRAA